MLHVCYFFISIHAPLAGCDVVRHDRRAAVGNFNPRTPCGVRLIISRTAESTAAFQSTHPLRGATFASGRSYPTTGISIHAPLAGCDLRIGIFSLDVCHFNPRTPCGVRRAALVRLPACHGISIHAPLAGCDNLVTGAMLRTAIFQSTHPLRGATAYLVLDFLFITISIHAPLAGCDNALMGASTTAVIFQSTHPLRGAT